MPQTIRTTVYTADELSGPAKQAAREWYLRELPQDWHEPVYEDFSTICALLGIELGQRRHKLYNGHCLEEPCIYFRGFSSQGDGACFEGHYAYARGARQAIRAHAPLDTTLHDIVDELQALQRPWFYRVSARITHRGPYYHEYTMHLDAQVARDPYPEALDTHTEERLAELMRRLARWLYRHLEDTYWDETSDEALDDALSAGEFTFTEHGERFG